jgi:exonuclease III
MAEIVDLTAINSDDEQQPAAPTIDLTKDSDDEPPPVKRARREAEAADGPIKIVAWNTSGVSHKTGKNRDKLARLVQRIGRVDAICVTECTVKRGEDDAARALLPGYDCYITHVQETTPREHRGAGVAFYIRRDSVLARNGRLLPSAPWDRAGMVGQYSCDVGVIVGAYLPTPTKKDAALREALDDEYPLLVKSHGHRLLCFCGDLNATLSRTLDSTKWFGGDNYNVSRTILENCISNLHLVDVVRNKWPATAKYTAFQSRKDKKKDTMVYWQARPDHFLVPQGRASRVEDIVVPDGEQWVRHIPAPASQPKRYEGERYISMDKEGELCGSDHVPIVVTMRLS